MEKFEKTKVTSALIFHSIWLAFSLFMYFGGMTVFEKTFGTWMGWGCFCAVIIFPFIWQMTVQSTRDGRKQGANSYTASVSGNTVTVSNHPFLGAVFGFAIGIFMSLLAGPIMAPIYMIKTISNIIKNAVSLKNSL